MSFRGTSAVDPVHAIMTRTAQREQVVVMFCAEPFTAHVVQRDGSIRGATGGTSFPNFA
jgi:hypothetical protein